ncbi:6-hydroxymethylpterin diphosphokinase MptE-like protein [Aeromonas rivipollensis]|uniref:motility associated factor glycosyltransferase family protein n=1 Tax=Aeromonas rivipollensis TaxID=948519 RepID=UPI003D08CEAE
MDMDKDIQHIEAEIIRLQRQKEQEQAMIDVLPVRFDNNMAAFKKYIPSVYEQFKTYNPARPFRFFCNENGIPNLLWLDSNTAFYGDDPYQFAKAQVEKILSCSTIDKFSFNVEDDLFNQAHVQYLNKLCLLYENVSVELERLTNIPEHVPMIMMFGVGLGYQFSYLYEKCSVRNLFVFEPNLDLFYASLFSFDWDALLQHLDRENLSLHLFLGQDEESLMSDLLPALHKKGAFWISSVFAFWHYPSEKIFSLVERIKKEFYLLKSGWGFFDDNLFALAHSAKNIENKTPFLLKGKDISSFTNNLPALVVGNGPSLDENIQFIKDNQGKFFLFSCGSSITALHKAGIKPDVLLAVERTKSSADFLALLNDDDYLRDILFLSVDIIHPECRHYFNRMAVGFKPYEPMHGLLMSNVNNMASYAQMDGVNPFVGNTGLSYAITLGFKEIYLFGIDNGYKNPQHHHSKLSNYYDDNEKPIEQLTKLVTQSACYTIPGNFGGEVTTDRLFCVSIKSMESLLKLHEHVTCYNCSDGAAIEGAIPLHTSDVVMNNVIHDKIALTDIIYNKFFSPLDVTRKDIEEFMAFDFFDSVLEKMISDWKHVEMSRSAVSEQMQKHFEYLVFISNTRQRHIFRVLVGSVNYFFSFINTIMYSFDDIRMNDKIVSPSIAIMIEFFEVMKSTYPEALNFIDESDCEILQLYRKNTTRINFDN